MGMVFGRMMNLNMLLGLAAALYPDPRRVTVMLLRNPPTKTQVPEKPEPVTPVQSATAAPLEAGLPAVLTEGDWLTRTMAPSCASPA